jgi:hypothetical protein
MIPRSPVFTPTFSSPSLAVLLCLPAATSTASPVSAAPEESSSRTPRPSAQSSRLGCLQLDELAACKVVSLQQTYLPPRSRLYNLRPIGISTPDVESLTGYIARLFLNLGNANESLAATARRWGRRPVTVQAWLNGKRTPQLGALLDICRTFETSPLRLLALELPRSQANTTATACVEAISRRNWTSHRIREVLAQIRLELGPVRR